MRHFSVAIGFVLLLGVLLIGSALPTSSASFSQDRGHSVELVSDPTINRSIVPASNVPIPDASVSLALDDGGAENFLGVNDAVDGTQFIWFTRFTPSPSSFPFLLEEIWVVFGSEGVGVGDAVDLLVYQDADGDGNPSNATHLATYYQIIQYNDQVTWNVYTLAPSLMVNGSGDILIGVINRYQTGTGGGVLDYPASLDETTSQQHSWVGWWTVDVPSDPPVWPPNDVLDTIDNLGFPGNWLIRGYGNTVAPADTPTPTTTRTSTLTATYGPSPTPTVTRTPSPSPTITPTPLHLYLPMAMRSWPPVPDVPLLNPIYDPEGDGFYTVDWNLANRAETYTLQEDDNAGFSSPEVRYWGAETYWNTPGQVPGTYYYRVRASNGWGDSGWSNIHFINIQPPTPTSPPTNTPRPPTATPGPECDLYIDNQTGGRLCYTVNGTGIGKTCWTTSGTHFYGSFPRGTYSYSVTGCGTSDSGSRYYPAGYLEIMYYCTSEMTLLDNNGARHGAPR